jgi:hypothetical protein
LGNLATSSGDKPTDCRTIPRVASFGSFGQRQGFVLWRLTVRE